MITIGGMSWKWNSLYKRFAASNSLLIAELFVIQVDYVVYQLAMYS